jgi:V/A-type H+-transporting ATPase subunit E
MKIEELTRKIYEEGVEKAKKQEEELLKQARKEAERIVGEARREAAETAETARKEAARARELLASELKLAGNQAIAQLKRRIVDCLLDAMLPPSVSSALNDTGFIQKIIIEIVERWDHNRMNIDLEVVLSPQNKDVLAAQFAAKAKGLLERGLTLRVSDELKNGFRIQPGDGSYRISFEEEDFVAFFRAFLRERTRKILFPTEEMGDAVPAAGQTEPRR